MTTSTTIAMATDGASAVMRWFGITTATAMGMAMTSYLGLRSTIDFVADGGTATIRTQPSGAIEDDCTDASDYNCDGSVGIDDADGDGFIACEAMIPTQTSMKMRTRSVMVDNNCDGVVDGEDAID